LPPGKLYPTVSIYVKGKEAVSKQVIKLKNQGNSSCSAVTFPKSRPYRKAEDVRHHGVCILRTRAKKKEKGKAVSHRPQGAYLKSDLANEKKSPDQASMRRGGEKIQVEEFVSTLHATERVTRVEIFMGKKRFAERLSEHSTPPVRGGGIHN